MYHKVIFLLVVFRRCLQNVMSNKGKPVEYFKEISFPYLEDITREKGFLLEQLSLVLMDTF